MSHFRIELSQEPEKREPYQYQKFSNVSDLGVSHIKSL